MTIYHILYQKENVPNLISLIHTKIIYLIKRIYFSWVVMGIKRILRALRGSDADFRIPKVK